MKTDDLIALLAADAPARGHLDRRLGAALAAGILVSGGLLLATYGLRPDIASVIETARVLFKIGATLLLAVLAAALALRVGRPGLSLRMRGTLLLLPAALLAAAVALELAVVPAGDWRASMLGQHAIFCVFFIPVLSLAPLAGLMLALREGAPENPTLAGAVAGLSASAIGAALYAWHCPDDSPLFVAVWYGLAIALVTTAGALIGRRLLRW